MRQLSAKNLNVASWENGLPFDLETLCGERLWLFSAVWALTPGTPFSSLFYPLPSSSSHYCCQAPSAFTPRPLFLKTRGCLRGWWCVPEVKKGPHRTGASHARFMLANPDKPQERARKRERGDAGKLFLNPPGLYRPCSLEFWSEPQAV